MNKPVLNSATKSYRTLLTASPNITAHKQTLELQKPSVPYIMGRLKKRAGMSACGQVIGGV